MGGQPEPAIGPFRGAFRGAADIAFAPKGRIFISDGYANARILEYTADGRKVREWGSAGTGPGEFHLPHSIVADESNMLYVADRDNGRIEKFDLDGTFLGEFPNLGRTYSLKLGANGTLWAGMQPLNEPPGAPGWVVKLDRRTGKILGLRASEREGGSSLRGGRRRGSAHDGRWERSRLVQEARGEQYPISRQTRKGRRSSHTGKPMRRRRFWKRASERRGSKPGRSRTPGLNRSSKPFSSQFMA